MNDEASIEETAMIDRKLLQSYALFGGVSDSQFSTLEALLQTEHYPAGAYLFHQGDPGDRLYLIIAGTVEVLNEADGSTTQLSVRGVGDSIGEMTLIDIQNRSASVRALEPVTVLSLGHYDLQCLYDSDNQLFVLIIMNIAREISRRLRSMNALLSSTLYAGKEQGGQEARSKGTKSSETPPG